MVEGVSGGIVYHPIPFLQKLFAHRQKKLQQRDRAETSIGS